MFSYWFSFSSDNLIIDTTSVTTELNTADSLATEVKPVVVRTALWIEREPIDSDCSSNVSRKIAENTQENTQDDAASKIVKHVVKMNNWAF